jgi:cyclically-permuted mutarotase family protein
MILYGMIIASIMSGHEICCGQATAASKTQWQVIARLPALAGTGKGLAGMYGGLVPGGVLLAGGSDFPGKMPWEGGSKAYYNQVYLLTETDGRFDCRILKDTLPFPMAYGASVNIPGGVFIVGGECQAGALNSAFILSFDTSNNRVGIKRLPDMPEKLSHLSATVINQKVYVAGGDNKLGTTTCFFSIDLAAAEPGWEKEKDLPIPLAYTVTVSQKYSGKECVYVIGGRATTNSGISALHGTIFRYNILTRNWTEMAGFPGSAESGNLSASTGISLAKDTILLIGGDDGIIFSRIEKINRKIAKATGDKTRQALEQEKLQLVQQHPGFSRKVWMYDTKKEKWHQVGELPYAPVTTTAVLWNNKVIIPGGEIHPGVRTPDIILGRLF